MLVREAEVEMLVRGAEAETLVRDAKAEMLVRGAQTETLVRGAETKTLIRGAQAETLVRWAEVETPVKGADSTLVSGYRGLDGNTSQRDHGRITEYICSSVPKQIMCTRYVWSCCIKKDFRNGLLSRSPNTIRVLLKIYIFCIVH